MNETIWNDEDMIHFARVASKGSYGDYRGCNSLVKKLARYKTLIKNKLMSRYTKELDNGKTIAYGYDGTLGYYFDVFDVPDGNDREILLIEESSALTGMNNGKMIELMDIYKLPESHIELVAMDLPI